MTQPRQVLPDRCYLITRRCTQRTFLLRPSKHTKQAFLYCLAEAAARFDIDVLWVMACSNHYHAGIHDRHGRYPAFIEHFHKLLAKILNVHWGRWENVWATEQTSVVLLSGPEDIFDKLIYSLTNPVKDNLVEHAHDWPGATSLFKQLADTPLTVKRPTWFFASDTTMPDAVTLRFARPKPFEHLSHDDWTAQIHRAIRAVERRAAAKRQSTGKRVLGRKRILAQSAFASPTSHAPRRQLSPRVACRNKWRRIELLRRNQDFLAAYRAALITHRSALTARRPGDSHVTFPRGTYKLILERHIRCPSTAAA